MSSPNRLGRKPSFNRGRPPDLFLLSVDEDRHELVTSLLYSRLFRLQSAYVSPLASIYNPVRPIVFWRRFTHLSSALQQAESNRIVPKAVR